MSEGSSPFVPSTTPNIERANRLLALRGHPGFSDLLRLSQILVQEAVDACTNFGGWDPQQFIVLVARMKCATEYHQQLLIRINAAIQAGLDEARAQLASMPTKTAAEAIDQGDFIRQRVLQKFDEQDNRVPGSYEVADNLVTGS